MSPPEHRSHATLGPLSGLRVLDLVDGPLELVSRLLADLGADVVTPDASIVDSTRHRNKRIASDDYIMGLASTADVVIIDCEAEGRHNLDERRLRQDSPELLWVTVSEFGKRGDRSAWAASPGVHMALSGALARSGLPEQGTPLMPPTFIVDITAAVHCVWTIMLGIVAAARSGRGQRIDFSVADAMIHALDPAFGIKGSVLGAQNLSATIGRPDAAGLYPVFAAEDGWVRLCMLSPRQWKGMFKWLGEPAEFADERFDRGEERLAAAPTLYPLIAAHLAGMSQADAIREGQARGIPIAGVKSFQSAIASAAMHESGAIVDVEQPDGTVRPEVQSLFVIDGRRAPTGRATPGNTWRSGGRFFDHLSPWDNAEMPLEGIRVLDLGVIVAGAEASRLLADYGADVIKVESREHLDGSRLATLATGMSESFARGHRNKRSFGVDLRQAEGKEVFRRLVTRSDVVLSNFKPGTLKSLGIDFASLSRVNSSIVTVESSAFGESESFQGYFGYGPLVRAMSGLTHQWRYPHAADSFGDGLTVFPDHLAGRISAILAVAMVLRERALGIGGEAKAAQIDIIMNAASQVKDLEDRRVPRDAPQGVFAAQGEPAEDQWIYVEVDGDNSFDALCRVTGRSDLLKDARFATSVDRIAHREELEREICAWASGIAPETAAMQLQQAGVRASPVVHEVTLPGDGDLADRCAFAMLMQPQYPQGLRVHAVEAGFSSLPKPLMRPAPLLAEHTRQIADGLLGLDAHEVARLVDDGTLFVHDPAPSVAGRALETRH